MIRRYTSPETCSAKYRWPNAKRAKAAASRTSRQLGVPCVAYRCNHCGEYHVSKREVVRK